MTNFKKATEFQSSSLQGELDISYAELVSVFGPPHHNGDGYKVDAEWELVIDFGKFQAPFKAVYATIYNYKSGKNYNGHKGDDVKDIRDWHVGGNSYEAVEAVLHVIKDSKLKVESTTTIAP